ncbi:putative transcriptional regulatory protein YedW [bioreactor metagenome]|uniref:Putative transcriptional regulatory protein YedW n=1 Tax=bioreactor metagenome TaxID=1076179 RepID=A0A645JBV5_9ZZZZ
MKIEEDHPDLIKKPTERAAVQKQRPMAADKIKLLLVEDNPLNMEIAQTILEEKGYLVECVENGEEALKIFMQSEPYTYQLILMDLQMPVMDGYTAAREIRDCEHFQAKSIPIIALTANAFAEDMAKALAAGMNDYVSKPIDFNKLTDVIEKCMNQ